MPFTSAIMNLLSSPLGVILLALIVAFVITKIIGNPHPEPRRPRCRQCGREHPPRANFCRQCGRRMT